MSNPLSFLNGSLHLRYTPPTCTLEVTAKRSPLSRWTNQPTFKDLRFELSFDDPRLPAEKQIAIGGDRVGLDLLYQAVTDYVQNFLQQSSDWLNDRFLPVPTIDRHSEVTSNIATLSRSQSWQTEQPLSYLGETTNGQPEAVYLKPRGLVAHDLILGPLATAESGAWISLGAIQLFDLAAALDEYASVAMALPELEIDRPPQVRPAVWAGAGAAAALLVVGLASTFWRFYDTSKTSETTASAPVEQTSGSPSQIPPLNPIPVPTQGPPPPLSARQPTPTPTPTPTPQASVTPQASAPKLEAPKEVKPTPIAIPSNAPTAQTTPEAGGGQSLLIPGGSEPSSPPPLQPQPQLQPQPPLQVQPQPPTLAPIEVAPEPPPFRPPVTVAPDAGLPSALPTLPPTGDRSAAAKGGLGNAQGDDSATAGTRTRREGSGNLNLLEEEAQSPPSAFEVIPQVRDVKIYFQEHWQPPEGLTLPLQYTLILNEDGSLQEAIPLGLRAEYYLERTGIPLPGSSIASPASSGQQPRIRLFLDPNGDVNTLLER